MAIVPGYCGSVLRMRTKSTPTRFLCGALFALLLGLRLLGATGYMPGFDRGVATIIVCPDAEVDAPLAIEVPHHHHGHDKHRHGGQCPFGSASAMSTLAAGFAALLIGMSFAEVPLLGRDLQVQLRNRRRERPPSHAPPRPA